MSQLAALLGEPIDYEYEGKTYKVSRRTIRIEAAMEVWAENQALDAIERQRPRVGPDGYERLLAIWQRDVAADVYCYEGEVMTRALSTPGPTQRRLALLQLTALDHQPHKADEELVDRVFRDERDAYAAYKRLVLAMARADGRVPPALATRQPDPNAPAAAVPEAAA